MRAQFLKAFKASEHHNHTSLAIIRMFLGVMLISRAAHFVSSPSEFMDSLRGMDMPYTSLAVAHYIVLAHLIGGLMIAVGLLTRWAALAQVPILAGALIYAPFETNSVLMQGIAFEFTLMTFILLLIFTWNGSSHWALDRTIRRDQLEERRHPHHTDAHPAPH